MKLKQFKDWIQTLPSEFDEFDVVVSKNGEFTEADTVDETGAYYWRLDIPIIGLDVDADSKEICLEIKNEDK